MGGSAEGGSGSDTGATAAVFNRRWHKGIIRLAGLFGITLADIKALDMEEYADLIELMHERAEGPKPAEGTLNGLARAFGKPVLKD